MKPNWLIADAADEEQLKIYESCGVNRIIGSILYSRGIIEKDSIMSFLYPELNNLHSPFLMKGIPEAVTRIKKALADGEKIAIFADSDLDGITSLTILFDLLTKCGSTPEIRYPQNKEGYGLTCDIIDEFISSGVKLLITVDAGIRDLAEISYASENGIDTIITDHHEPDDTYPDAIIVNPKMPDCRYPFKELAGVGVAFKLAHALLFSYTGSYNKRFVIISSGGNKIYFNYIINGILVSSDSSESAELAGFLRKNLKTDDHYICTESTADLLNSTLNTIGLKIKGNTLNGMSNAITGHDYTNENSMLESLLKKYNIVSSTPYENEFIIKLFLELQLRSSRKSIERLQVYIALAAVGTIADIMPVYGENRDIIRYGLEVLKHGKGHQGIQALINSDAPTAKSITWDVAPLLNAPGRLGETRLTVDFFLNNDISRIPDIIRDIEKINRERKKLVQTITDQIKKSIASTPETDNRKIFFYMGNEILSGLAGLIASRIADDLKKPVIIAVEESGSDTVKGSGRSFNEFNFFRYVEPFSGMFERIGGHAQAFGFTAKKENIINIINAINDSIDDIYRTDDYIRIDSLIDINSISASLIDKLTLLEPFGKNNVEPVFLARNVIVDSFSKFGNNDNHGRFILKNRLHVIGWNMTEKMEYYSEGKKPVDMVFNLENNIFMNKKYPRIKLIDIDYS